MKADGTDWVRRRLGITGFEERDSEALRAAIALPGIGEFSLHGAGCLIERDDGSLVDFDWDVHGREVFDAWRMRRFICSRGFPDPDESAVLETCRRLVAEKLLVEEPRGWFRLVSGNGAGHADACRTR